MRSYVREVLLPAVRAIRADVYPPAPATPQPMADSPQSPQAAATTEPQAKCVFTIDGEHEQLQAFMDLFMEEFDGIPDADLFELVKFAAACSKTQQPADVSPCFFVLKQLVERLAVSEESLVPERYMPAVIKALKPLPLSEFTKYKNFMSHFLVLISTAFTRKNIRKGWENTGLYPLDTLQILSKCTSFKEYTDEQVQAMVVAIKSLTKKVAENGELTDADINAAMKGKVKFIALGRDTLEKTETDKSNKKPLHLLTLNRRRALLLSHPKIRAQRSPPAAAPGAAQPVHTAKSANKDGGRKRPRASKSSDDKAANRQPRRKKSNTQPAPPAAPSRQQPRRGTRDMGDALSLQHALVDEDDSNSDAGNTN